MTIETVTVAGLPHSKELDRLLADIDSAAVRAGKASPGDRLDVERFEALSTQLESLVQRAAARHTKQVDVDLSSGSRHIFGSNLSNWSGDVPSELLAAARSLFEAGLRPVVSVAPLTPGIAQAATAGSTAPPPAERWEGDGSTGSKAVEARFRAQIAASIRSKTLGQPASPISPSGVQNSVVTNILREFVTTDSGEAPVMAPVEYRDGSKSLNPMPLRALDLRENLPAFDVELRFALLSIRHTEMDATVNGAWLRNNEISRPRKQAETDDLVYAISRRQFDVLTDGGQCRVRLYLYQTGLEPAVVGFYKALTCHLIDYPGSVAVQPMFFSNRRPNRSKKNGGKAAGGSQRSGKGRGPNSNSTGSSFKKGLPWTM